MIFTCEDIAFMAASSLLVILQYWQCDRCGKNNKTREDGGDFRQIFVVMAEEQGGEYRTLARGGRPSNDLDTPIEFHICTDCLKEAFGDWGRDFFQEEVPLLRRRIDRFILSRMVRR
jgi:hypothetical protein